MEMQLILMNEERNYLRTCARVDDVFDVSLGENIAHVIRHVIRFFVALFTEIALLLLSLVTGGALPPLLRRGGYL